MDVNPSDLLPVVWLGLIAFFLLYYAVTDGFDLGVGMLSLCQRDPARAEALMATVSHVWHGNQTWLVILGGMLFGAFPLFYSVLLSGLYIPLTAMLFGLVFRGVAFEFRGASRRPGLWRLAFGLGSLLTTLAQGCALGGLLAGLVVEGDRFAGGVWDWWNGYSLLVAAGVLFGYLMLGANYLILRTDGEVRRRAYGWALRSSLATLGVSVGVHLWTVVRYPHVAGKWAAWPEVLAVSAPVALALVCFALFLGALRARRRGAPLAWNIGVVFFSFLGLSAGLYPEMIPSVVSPVAVQEAAASSGTLVFMLVTTAVVLPVILLYTAYTSRVALRDRGEGGEGGY